MSKKKRSEEWLTDVLTASYHYRGYEVSMSLEKTGGLHVVIYNDDNAELVWRGGNVCEALNFIDHETRDQAWGD